MLERRLVAGGEDRPLAAPLRFPNRLPSSICPSTPHATSSLRLPQHQWRVSVLPISIPKSKAHAHMLRHACGYKLANDGIDMRALQAYLGHRNIQNTTRHTALAPDRFKGFWRS
jgi:integrase